jgi:23S rRNA (guanosine2251-2'-O)-methyltransferase
VSGSGRGRGPTSRTPIEPSSSYLSGRRAATEAVRSDRAEEILLAEGARRTEGLRELLRAASEAGVPMRTVSSRRLDDLARGHQGVVVRLHASEPMPPALGERDLATFGFADGAVVVILDGITDPQNLGACARTAEAAGAAMLVSRTRRAAEVTQAAVRASAGALLHLPHARVANVSRAIVRLQEAGFFVVGLDAAGESIYDDDGRPPGRLALVVGSEGTGLSRLVRERCDGLVALPMSGRVASLNASAALAAVMYAYALQPRRVPPG